MDSAQEFEGKILRRLEFVHRAGDFCSWDWDVESDVFTVEAGESCDIGQILVQSDFSREKLIELTHPDDRGELNWSLDACLSGALDEWLCEHRYLNESGDWCWVAHRGSVIRRDGEGRVLSMIGMTQNIDSQKKSTLSLSAHREILGSAQDIAKLGYWEYYPESNSLKWSHQIRRIFGVDEGFDPNLEDSFKFFPEKDRLVVEEAFSRAVHFGEPYDLELKCFDVEGGLHITRAAARPQVDVNGKVYRIVGIFQDVTDVVSLEVETSAFFNLTPNYEATIGSDGCIRKLNAAWLSLESRSEATYEGRELREFIAEEDRSAFDETLERVKSGESVSDFETRVLFLSRENKDTPDEPTWFSWALSADSDLNLCFVSARDITKRKINERDLKEARARAEEANTAKANFLAVMSHELRTPLNPILGFAEMLGEEAESPEQAEMLQMIVDAGERMVDLVNEILEYSKVDGGRAKVELVEFSMSELVERKIQLVKGRADEQGLELSHSIDWGPLDSASPPVMLGDVNMLRQVVRNLMNNAVKFTKTGSVDLSVRFIEANRGRALVEFSITDTGIGIRAEDLGKLFEPFLQVDSGATREYGGAGLGLAICQRLVQLLDGTIRVESKLNQGSCFSFQVPLGYEFVDDEEVEPVLPSALEDDAYSVAQDEQSLFKKKLEGSVLVVEDNESNVIYLQKLLELKGIHAVCVNDGESALVALEESEFSIVLLDLHMPGIGGIETLKRIRSNEKFSNLPVYVLTADVSQQAKSDSMQFGADGLLTKPVTTDLVFELMSEHLQEA